MKRSMLLITALLINASALAGDKPVQTVSEYDSVRQTVARFLEGMKYHDIEKLRRVVHPEAKWLYPTHGSRLGQVAQEKTEREMKKHQKALAENRFSQEASTDRIAAIDVAGSIASARVEIENRFVLTTQFLSLMKFDDGWRIVSATVFNKLK
jgi:putative lumazine-binding protein